MMSAYVLVVLFVVLRHSGLGAHPTPLRSCNDPWSDLFGPHDLVLSVWIIQGMDRFEREEVLVRTRSSKRLEVRGRADRG